MKYERTAQSHEKRLAALDQLLEGIKEMLPSRDIPIIKDLLLHALDSTNDHARTLIERAGPSFSGEITELCFAYLLFKTLELQFAAAGRVMQRL